MIETMFEEVFWGMATNMVGLVVPIIGIMIIMKLIADAIFKEK